MREVAIPYRIFKDKETLKKEEFERLDNAAHAGNALIEFYEENQLYFDEDECELIEKIYNLFKTNHYELVAPINYGFDPSLELHRRRAEARKIIREETPVLIKELQKKLRNKLD